LAALLLSFSLSFSRGRVGPVRHRGAPAHGHDVCDQPHAGRASAHRADRVRRHAGGAPPHDRASFHRSRSLLSLFLRPLRARARGRRSSAFSLSGGTTMEMSTLIALAAFLFSFGTTIVSYRRANRQDVHNLKTELRGLLQRLAALPKENLEVMQKYA